MRLPSPGTRYRLLSLLLYLFWILHAIKHGYKHGLANYLSMRMFGFATGSETQVWVHASSVGEVRAVTPLVHALMQQGEKVLFTSFTATGYQAIRHHFADSVSSGVIPFDFYWPCRRFFRQHRLKLGLVMETELWPELLFQARRQGVALVQLNARLSPKSLRASGFLRALLKTTLGYFVHILTRSHRDQEALLSLGAPADRITIIGNLKSHNEVAPQQTRIIDRDYLILASSHSGEEQEFLELRPVGLKDYLLVIAPRHPDRSVTIQSLIERLEFNYAVRSKAQSIERDTEVYLADTLGELKSFLAYARVVIMGGSFDTTGGHNLIEPASLGCAIITGPSDSNITEDIKMLGNNSGVLQVKNMTACWQAIADLLADPERAAALGREGQSRLAQQPDIIQEYVVALDPYLQTTTAVKN